MFRVTNGLKPEHRFQDQAETGLNSSCPMALGKLPNLIGLSFVVDIIERYYIHRLTKIWLSSETADCFLTCQRVKTCSCFTWVLPGHLFIPLLKFQLLWCSHQALPPIAPSFQSSADLTITLIQGRFRDLHHSLPIHHYSHHPSLWLQYPLKTPILLSIPRPSFSDPRPPYLYKSVLPHLSPHLHRCTLELWVHQI